MSDFLDMGAVNQRLAAFDKRHGASIYDDGWIRFEDGACRESNPLGALIDPPTNPYDLAKRIAVFHKIIFERALRDFDQAKRNFRGVIQANLTSHVCGPAPAYQQVLSELNTLKAAVLAAKARHDKTDTAVKAARPGRDRENEEQNLRNQELNRNLLNAIDKIEL